MKTPVPFACLFLSCLLAVHLAPSPLSSQETPAPGADRAETPRPLPLADPEELSARLRAFEKIVLPEVNFLDRPATEALAFLERSAESDRGVRLEFAPGIDPSQPVNLRLVEVPLSEALRYLAALLSARIEVRDGAAVLAPAPPAPPSVATAAAPAAAPTEKEARQDAEERPTVRVYAIGNDRARQLLAGTGTPGIRFTKALEFYGIEMPLFASAVLNPDTGELIVSHYEWGHKKIEAFLAEYQKSGRIVERASVRDIACPCN